MLALQRPAGRFQPKLSLIRHLQAPGHARLTTNESLVCPIILPPHSTLPTYAYPITARPRPTPINKGNNTKRVQESMNSIPDESLSSFVTSTGKIFSHTDFHRTCRARLHTDSHALNFDQMTSEKPAQHNLQVQTNKQTTFTSLKEAAPSTVATLTVPADGSMSAAQAGQIII